MGVRLCCRCLLWHGHGNTHSVHRNHKSRTNDSQSIAPIDPDVDHAVPESDGESPPLWVLFVVC